MNIEKSKLRRIVESTTEIIDPSNPQKIGAAYHDYHGEPSSDSKSLSILRDELIRRRVKEGYVPTSHGSLRNHRYEKRFFYENV